ncbi:P-loop containing nucleoside triphosphate hydrolase protein [Rhizoclosmatium globosum]|uniref:p-loop containing nucleoside triphosphate hydrolase protein n=1 Tax=Rhizoclosmatium globosum TaxID=329046 RepID=A0A1Y2CBX4_9FUNG|nr:P-loop containing nucleoside triphosphate hydrolase protein [Rhizoclosmatium globosum]|eukprot:ORY43825.1 P-loop containing nucleoside triphosphate hydrolase protein [Rhizoclosmatium globosum]
MTEKSDKAEHTVLISGNKSGTNEIRWKNLTYIVPYGKKGETKTLLDNASGYVRQGQVVAIMGGSGAGKSTLLNTLAGRIAEQKGSELRGDILLNGEPRNPSNWTNICSYVEQDDLMFTNLSVEETLTYAAKLRLPSSMSSKQKLDKVNEVIMQLNLNGCRKTWIGDSLRRGISGGERKRVAIGVELVANPSILFLDEPTSGLDSANALGILETIKKIAVDRGMIVLMTIHQPRTEILDLFDKVILLSLGKTLWFGSTNSALDHFERHGHPLPPKTNPSDFFLDVITIDRRTPEAEKASSATIDKLHKAYNEKIGSYNSPFPSQLLHIDSRYVWPLAWHQEFAVLLSRNMKDFSRNGAAIKASLGQTFFLVILMGFVFFQEANDPAGVQSRIGFLFFICINQTFSVVMPNISVLPTVRTIFKRERAAGCYRASSCYLAKLVSSIPMVCLNSLMMSTPLYWMVGLQNNVTRFFTFILIILVHSNTAMSLAYCIGSAVPTAQVGQIIGPLTVIIFNLFAGQLVNIGKITWVFRWIQYISLISFSYKGLMQNEFKGLELQCTGQMQCQTYMGDVIVSQYSLEEPSKYFCVLINVGLATMFLILGYVFFQRTSRPMMRLK